MRVPAQDSHGEDRPLFSRSADWLLARDRAADQLGARADAQLLEDAPQVVINRSRTDEQLRCHLTIRGALRHGSHYLKLLPRQLIECVGLALARRLSSGAQLTACPFRPRDRA